MTLTPISPTILPAWRSVDPHSATVSTAPSFHEFLTRRVFEGVVRSGRTGWTELFLRLHASPATIDDLGEFAAETGVVQLPQEIDGTVHTGFVRDPDVAAAICGLWRAVDGWSHEPASARRERWRDHFSNSRDFQDLLSFYPDEITTGMVRDLEEGRVELDFFSREQMKKFVEEESQGRPVLSRWVEAAYDVPPAPGRPRIILRNLMRERRAREEAETARDLIANARHEYVHIRQVWKNGIRWPREHLVPSEMVAFVREITLRLAAGDEKFFHQVCDLSPFGFAMGLRNYIERVY